MRTKTIDGTVEIIRSQTMNSVKIDGRTILVSKYHTLSLARNHAAQRLKPARIVTGDYDDPWGAFWVCRPVDAERLQKAGYQITQ